mgnify:CR=1 FL=1
MHNLWGLIISWHMPAHDYHSGCCDTVGSAINVQWDFQGQCVGHPQTITISASGKSPSHVCTRLTLRRRHEPGVSCSKIAEAEAAVTGAWCDTSPTTVTGTDRTLPNLL